MGEYGFVWFCCILHTSHREWVKSLWTHLFGYLTPSWQLFPSHVILAVTLSPKCEALVRIHDKQLEKPLPSLLWAVVQTVVIQGPNKSDTICALTQLVFPSYSKQSTVSTHPLEFLSSITLLMLFALPEVPPPCWTPPLHVQMGFKLWDLSNVLSLFLSMMIFPLWLWTSFLITCLPCVFPLCKTKMEVSGV